MQLLYASEQFRALVNTHVHIDGQHHPHCAWCLLRRTEEQSRPEGAQVRLTDWREWYESRFRKAHATSAEANVFAAQQCVLEDLSLILTPEFDSDTTAHLPRDFHTTLVNRTETLFQCNCSAHVVREDVEQCCFVPVDVPANAFAPVNLTALLESMTQDRCWSDGWCETCRAPVER